MGPIKSERISSRIFILLVISNGTHVSGVMMLVVCMVLSLLSTWPEVEWTLLI